MNKLQLVKIPLGNGQFRGRVSFLSEPYDRGTLEERLERLRLLEAVGQNPDMQVVAGHDFDTMKMHYTGGRWQIDLEADL